MTPEILKNMTTRERHAYLMENTSVCPQCGETKRQTFFWDDGKADFEGICRPCRKFNRKKETVEIMIGFLKPSDLDDI